MKFMAKINPTSVKKLVPEEKQEIPYVGCYIESIDQLGKVVLKFNSTLIHELVYKVDLKKVLKFEIIPLDLDRDDVDQIQSLYQFDWKVTGFDKVKWTIDFQLDFKNADAISSGKDEDIIKVDILDRRYFQPEISHRLL